MTAILHLNASTMKIDILLLTDIFKNFCESCVAAVLRLRSCALLHLIWFHMGRHVETRIRFELLTDIDMIMFSAVYAATSVNVQADIRRLITSTYIRTTHWNRRRILYTTT